jgi:hypothetical protein
VPTKVGWVFVNPYMTLVAAYERLIGERGSELADPSLVATADSTAIGAAPPAMRIEPDRVRRVKAAKAGRKTKFRHRQRQASR